MSTTDDARLPTIGELIDAHEAIELTADDERARWQALRDAHAALAATLRGLAATAADDAPFSVAEDTQPGDLVVRLIDLQLTLQAQATHLQAELRAAAACVERCIEAQQQLRGNTSAFLVDAVTHYLAWRPPAADTRPPPGAVSLDVFNAALGGYATADAAGYPPSRGASFVDPTDFIQQNHF